MQAVGPRAQGRAGQFRPGLLLSLSTLSVVHSIRWRLALLTMLVTVAALGASFVVIEHKVATDARERLRERAFVELESAAVVFEVTRKLREGATLDPTAGPALLREGTGTRPVSLYDGNAMWASVQLPREDRRLTVRLAATPIDEQRSSTRAAFGLAALGGLAVALVLASIAAVSMSRRLRHASVTARSIAEGASTRIRDPGRDEIAVLSAAVDDMADALLERLQAEVAFSADVAHELRTPVTGLVSAAELLGDGLPADLVRSQVARLRALVEDLLEISRLDSGAEPTHLAPARLLDLVPGATGDSEELVMAEPRRVDRIVANLVDNARKHARSEPRLRVEGASLLVEDDGAGFPAPLLDGEPRRFRRHSGAPGSGLGLAICFAQARAMGARIELSNNPAGGGRVRVSFTPAGATAAQEG